MKKIILGALAFTGAAVLVAVVAPRITNAADHLDGPRAKGDPAADITDVYTFMSPATPGHIVLIMNVFPKADANSKLSDKVTYNFRIKPVTGLNPITLGANMDVTCNAALGNITCTAPAALTKTVAFGATGACALTDDICVYAGVRSDPFFFDLVGFDNTVTSNPQAVKFTGTNFFAGLNVVSIVVELNADKAFNPNAGPKPVLFVAAETNRAP